METINISKDEQNNLIKKLKEKNNIDSQRLLRLLSMSDLTRTKWNPVELIINRILNIPMFEDFDIIETPEIVPVDITFDPFNFPKNHPARSKSDTYYVDDKNILRTHTTIMWYYYLNHSWIREKLDKTWEAKVLSYGKVYRKDEIDSNHYPVFHQIDWLYICEKNKKIIWKQDLVDILVSMAKSIYWEDIKYRVNEDTFPYTDPSIEMEVKFWDKWLEVLWAWVVMPLVMANFWLDPDKYNGWAFGPWVERLAMIKMEVPDIRIFWSNDSRITNQWWNLDKKYIEVSKYPEIPRDISFIVDKNISLNNYYEIVRDLAWDLVEHVELLDKYENDEKFWKEKISYTFRIIYRSHERTLLNDEINDIQTNIRSETAKKLNAELR